MDNNFVKCLRLHFSRPGARFSKVPKTFRAREAIRETPTCLICKAGLFICCIGNKNLNNCKVSCLETPSFWRYKENYVTRIAAEKSRDFWETDPRAWTHDNFHSVRLLYKCFSLPPQCEMLKCEVLSRERWENVGENTNSMHFHRGRKTNFKRKKTTAIFLEKKIY